MTSSEHLMHVQVTTCVHGNFKIFELEQGKLSLSQKKKNCVEVAFKVELSPSKKMFLLFASITALQK